jgi:hypothetical protein
MNLSYNPYGNTHVLNLNSITETSIPFSAL